MAEVIPGAAVVATDDVAWWFSMFDWSAELITNVIEPVRRGEPVTYRPPGWVARDRPGVVSVPGSLSLLVIEGVGSSQAALTGAIDAAIWVQSDAAAARERGLARDIASGDNGDAEETVRFWDDWAAQEEPFLERDEPWTRADAIVAGVPLLRPPVLHRAGAAVES